MFTRSEQFIKALHEGDILQFLEWPTWLTKHHLNQDCTQDADATLDLLRGEWLRCGYTDKDTFHIAIVYQLLNEKDSLLQSIHEYSASALCGAANQCIVYTEILKENKKLTFDDPTLKPYQKNNLLLDKAEETLKNLNEEQKLALNKTRQQLKTLFFLREIVSSYLLFLEKIKIENDRNISIRIGLTRNMKTNLDTHTKCDDTCRAEVDTFMKTIRTLSPTQEEETDYLSYILPIQKTVQANYLLNTLNWGLSLFFSSTDKTTNTEILLLEDNKPSQDSNAP